MHSKPRNSELVDIVNTIAHFYFIGQILMQNKKSKYEDK